MNFHSDITKAVGGTPLVKLNRICAPSASLVLAKLEFYNPTSSVKDRIGIAMIDDAEKRNLLNEGDTIIEATSGNTGIALAMVAAARGYKLILTMPESMSKERRALLRAYGATLILTPASEGMNGSVKKAKELANENNYLYLSQFDNLANPQIHKTTTAMEIWEDTAGEVDIFIAGVGTGGTITGVGEVLKKLKPSVEIVAVQPQASPLLTGGKPGPHIIQGIGPNFIPSILNQKIIDRVISVQNEEALIYAKRASKEEGILAGISSGAALAATSLIANELNSRGKTIVTLLPSYGERYLSTLLFEEYID